jgi:hypothetical protein
MMSMSLDPKDKFGTIDPRISLGSVLSIVAIAVSISLAWANLSSTLARQDERQMAIERQLDREQKDHDDLVQLAVDVREIARINGIKLPETKP